MPEDLYQALWLLAGSTPGASMTKIVQAALERTIAEHQEKNHG